MKVINTSFQNLDNYEKKDIFYPNSLAPPLVQTTLNMLDSEVTLKLLV